MGLPASDEAMLIFAGGGGFGKWSLTDGRVASSNVANFQLGIEIGSCGPARQFARATSRECGIILPYYNL